MFAEVVGTINTSGLLIMGKTASKPKWCTENSRVVLSTGNEFLFPSAVDIVRAEFKGVRQLGKIAIDASPSQHLNLIHIHRFPPSVIIRLHLPNVATVRPEINI